MHFFSHWTSRSLSELHKICSNSCEPIYSSLLRFMSQFLSHCRALCANLPLIVVHMSCEQGTFEPLWLTLPHSCSISGSLSLSSGIPSGSLLLSHSNSCSLWLSLRCSSAHKVLAWLSTLHCSCVAPCYPAL